MKNVNQTNGKGLLEIDWNENRATLTHVTKDEELVYDFFKVLDEYNGKSVSFSIKEEKEIETLED